MAHSGQLTFPTVQSSEVCVEKKEGGGEPISQVVSLLFPGKTNDSYRIEYPKLSETGLCSLAVNE